MLEKLTEPISEEELEKSAQFLADLISIPTYEDRPDALLGAVQLCAGYLSSNKNIKVSDARWFAEKNIPVIITQVRGGGLHSVDEWVDINSLIQLTNVVIEFCDSSTNSTLSTPGVE